MILGIPIESGSGEKRVALTPQVLPALGKAGLSVLVESGAGTAAGYPDEAFAAKGARIAPDREAVFREADILAQVAALGANPSSGMEDLSRMREGQILVGMADPLGAPEGIREAAARKVSVFSLELLPRISRAQSMDVLSSMATIAGYKAVLLAAATLPRIFPLLMTAAGTVHPSRVFVMGAGVAGLTAIATARRLGAQVTAYDVRPAVKEQVESLGAKFLEFPLPETEAEDAGGYAKAQDEAFLRMQRERMTEAVSRSDVVITTAQVPGRKAPVLVTKEMVEAMEPGSVIVDLAAAQGGNCELTRPGEEVTEHGVTILGPLNLPATLPYHASQMYAKNVSTFLLHILREGAVAFDRDDEIARGTLAAHGGEVLHPRVREALGLPPLDAPPEGSRA
ncbi:MAG: Re/Si-specific NAD(P)(+) transhydrogenase subunit alpha [Deltaproteobacteria bacterium]